MKKPTFGGLAFLKEFFFNSQCKEFHQFSQLPSFNQYRKKINRAMYRLVEVVYE